MNPIIPTVFTADPAARVWPDDDRLWLYTSHDEPGTNTHDTMASYHVFSTRDLVHWTDYGIALHLKDVDWAASHMWAIDAVYWRGTYHLVFCAYEKNSGCFRTGIAVSPRPQGPFRNVGYIRGVEHGQDPALFVDDDGSPYLFWGYGGQCFACRLANDLMSAVPGTQVELTAQIAPVFEGPWVHKHDGRYYLSFPALTDGRWPQEMCYAIADRPLGPYTRKGAYIPRFSGQAGTNHGSIVHYRGRWLAFHHSKWISDNGVVRSSMCDELFYEADGSIRPIVPTREGISFDGAIGPNIVELSLDAASAPMAGGSWLGLSSSTAGTGWTGAGFVEGFDAPHKGIVFCAQSGLEARYRVHARYRAPWGDQRMKVRCNQLLLDDPERPTGAFDKHVEFPAASDWAERCLGEVTLRAGDNLIRISCGTGGIQLDGLRLRPVTP